MQAGRAHEVVGGPARGHDRDGHAQAVRRRRGGTADRPARRRSRRSRSASRGVPRPRFSGVCTSSTTSCPRASAGQLRGPRYGSNAAVAGTRVADGASRASVGNRTPAGGLYTCRRVFGRIDHIGVAVEDLDAGIALYESGLRVALVHREAVDRAGRRGRAARRRREPRRAAAAAGGRHAGRHASWPRKGPGAAPRRLPGG